MTTEQTWVVATGAVALVVALSALLVALRARGRAAHAEALAAALTERLAVLESPGTGLPHADAPAPVVAGEDGREHARETSAFVITRMDADEHSAVPLAREIDGRLFTDIVVRETVVKAASWTHGLRRALSPESRNRIRFEVRQETRRAGRERRAEMKQALREFRARERAATGDRDDIAEDVA